MIKKRPNSNIETIKRSKKTLQSLLFIVICCFAQKNIAQTNTSQLKAALLLKFANNISWSNDNQRNSYQINFVSSDTVMLEAIEYYAKTRKINDKPLKIKQLSTPEYDCDILYLDRHESQRIERVYEQIANREILLVSEQCSEPKYIMLNILTNYTSKNISFEINKANILLQNLNYETELLLLGGTEIDVRELYRSMRESLHFEKQNVQKQRDTIALQVREMTKNQQNLDLLQESVLNLQSKTIAKEHDLAILNQQILKQQQSFAKQTQLSDNQRFLLEQQTKELYRRKNQISRQIETLRRLKREGYKRNSIIKTQNEALSTKESLIAAQKLLIWAFLAAGILFLALLVFAFILYRNKKRANKILEHRVLERTEQLQLSNDTLREEIRERIAVETELERHRSHLEILVNDRTAELLCSNEELNAINEQLVNTNEILEQQKQQLEDALEKLQSAQLQLIQSEKMASLGFLTAGIAHEINNPLNYIKSGVEAHSILYARFIEYLEQYRQLFAKTVSEQEQKEFSDLEKTTDLEKLNRQFTQSANNINTGIDRIVAIVRSLRLFSRADSNVIVPIQIPETIEAALVMFANKTKGRIEIHTNYQPLVIETYSEQIFQVLVNLISNAVGASKATGEIWIRCYSISTNEICIELSDNGIGMSTEVKTKLFEPFFTTKKTGEGTGLGLSLSAAIIKKHNGRIEFVSTKDVGTSFFLYLPVKQQ